MNTRTLIFRTFLPNVVWDIFEARRMNISSTNNRTINSNRELAASGKSDHKPFALYFYMYICIC